MKIGTFALGILVIVATLAAFAVPDAQLFREPALARIIFWHVPCAILSSIFVLASAFFALRYLMTKDRKWDLRVGAAIELGCLAATLAMVTGIIFSRVQWGAWWQNDPRQTSFLVVLLTLFAGLALRGALGDELKRANTSAIYSVATVIPVIFFTFVFPRLSHIAQTSFHPSQTIATNQLDTNYRLTLYLCFATLALCFIAAYRRRVKVGELEFALENDHELDNDHRRRPADPDLVRPVALPSDRR